MAMSQAGATAAHRPKGRGTILMDELTSDATVKTSEISSQWLASHPTALAAMSTFAHAAYDYFKQRHAQVTNPPIDPIREGHVMTTDVWLGQRPNCVDVALELDAGADLVRIETPIMHQAELDEVASVLSTTTLSTVYDPATESLEQAVKRISEEAVAAVRDGAKLVVLSDKTFEPTGDKLYVQPLIAVGASHHALISSGLRMSASLVVETAQVFGYDRSFFESNVPIDGRGADYPSTWAIFSAASDFLSNDEQIAMDMEGLTDNITCYKSAMEALDGAHAVTVMTEWDEFKAYDWKEIYGVMQKPAFVFDGRNILDHEGLKEIGFIVYALGKPIDPFLKSAEGA